MNEPAVFLSYSSTVIDQRELNCLLATPQQLYSFPLNLSVGGLLISWCGAGEGVTHQCGADEGPTLHCRSDPQ